MWSAIEITEERINAIETCFKYKEEVQVIELYQDFLENIAIMLLWLSFNNKEIVPLLDYVSFVT